MYMQTVIGFEQGAYSVAEGGSVELCVTWQSGPVGGTFLVGYFINGITAGELGQTIVTYIIWNCYNITVSYNYSKFFACSQFHKWA